MNNEMICKNCKYHYIEEISFDYPQSCCDKRKAVIEEWFKCDAFEYDDRYIEQLQQENKQLKIQISAREEVCKRLESNWNKLKEWVNKQYDYYMNEKDYIGGRLCFGDMKNNMQEIEQKGNSNVKD